LFPTREQGTGALKKPHLDVHRLRFNIGLALLLLNVPIGWGGLALGGIMAVWTNRHGWLVGGIALYALSWVLMGLGFVLAGHSGWVRARAFWRRRTRLIHLRGLRAARDAARRAARHDARASEENEPQSNAERE
jgi:hypothetical protein